MKAEEVRNLSEKEREEKNSRYQSGNFQPAIATGNGQDRKPQSYQVSQERYCAAENDSK